MLKVILFCIVLLTTNNSLCLAESNAKEQAVLQTEPSGVKSDANGKSDESLTDVKTDGFIEWSGNNAKKERKVKKRWGKFASNTSWKLAPTVYYNFTSGNVDVGVAFLLQADLDVFWLFCGIDGKYYNAGSINRPWISASSDVRGEFGRYKNIADVVAVFGVRGGTKNMTLGVSFGLGVGVVKMRLYNTVDGGEVNGTFGSFRMRIGLEFGYKRFYIKPEFFIVDYSRSYIDNDGYKRHYSSRYYTDSYGRRRHDSRCGGEFSVGIGMYLF